MSPRPVHRLARRHLPLLILLLPTTACGGWERVALPAPARLHTAKQVQVWRQGAMLQLHGVVVSGDSLSGIPFLRPLTCDTCRVTLPLASIDSVRTGDPVGELVVSSVVVLVGVIALLFAACVAGASSCDHLGWGGT